MQAKQACSHITLIKWHSLGSPTFRVRSFWQRAGTYLRDRAPGKGRMRVFWLCSDLFVTALATPSISSFLFSKVSISTGEQWASQVHAECHCIRAIREPSSYQLFACKFQYSLMKRMLKRRMKWISWGHAGSQWKSDGNGKCQTFCVWNIKLGFALVSSPI